MAENFGLKIWLVGEKEFKSVPAEINNSFKVLGSEMKLVKSQFDKNDNSVQALTARNKILEKSIVASTKYQELVKLKEHRISQSKTINLFIKSLEEKPLVLDQWDNFYWALFVDKAIVHKDKSITFIFNNGKNIKIEAL